MSKNIFFYEINKNKTKYFFYFRYPTISKVVINDATTSEIDEFGAVYLFKNYGKAFQILTQIASCFLAIPATSIPCESLSSQCGLTMTDLRNRMSPETLENLILIKEYPLP